MTDPLAALLVPELRWDPDHGYAYLDEAITEWMAMGVGGFVVRNGPQAEVAALCTRLQRDAPHPLLLASPAERGAGECYAGATGLPPFAALGALRDEDAIRRAARLTARELRAIGLNWVLAPCADIAVDPQNPVLGSRSLGAEVQKVAEWCVAWIDACQAEGVLATALQMPGVGRASSDPALRPTRVEAAGAALWNSDLVPFRAAVDSGVATVLASQVSYPQLDKRGVVAAQSRVVLHDLLREELQFEGIIVGELPSEGTQAPDAEAAAAVAMVAAGCDLLLAPRDVAGVADALDAALRSGVLHPDAVDAALARRRFWADWGRAGPGRDATLEDVLWARQVSDTVVHALRGVFANVGPVVDVILVDDDADRAWPRGGERFAAFLGTLRALGLDPRAVDGPSEEGRGAVVIAVLGEPQPGRGRAGYREETRRRVLRAAADARLARRSVLGVLFGPPTLADELPEVPNVICAWGGDRAMQEAAARRIA